MIISQRAERVQGKGGGRVKTRGVKYIIMTSEHIIVSEIIILSALRIDYIIIIITSTYIYVYIACASSLEPFSLSRRHFLTCWNAFNQNNDISAFYCLLGTGAEPHFNVVCMYAVPALRGGENRGTCPGHLPRAPL